MALEGKLVSKGKWDGEYGVILFVNVCKSVMYAYCIAILAIVAHTSIDYKP